MPDDFYDQLGAGYDAIINWEARLTREAPFYRQLFARHGVRSVLDTACGTGEHAALFASWGLEVVGADLSEEMIAVCRRKYADRPLEWVQAGFGETHRLLNRSFDAVTCLGNSWPHVLTDADAERAMRDFARLTNAGGVLLVQQLNYAAMRRRNERFLGPESRPIDGKETLFLRVFDLDRDPIRFNIVEMTREGAGWTRREWQTEHRAWTAGEMAGLLECAGFAGTQFSGDFAGGPFDAATSDQMIVVVSK